MEGGLPPLDLAPGYGAMSAPVTSFRPGRAALLSVTAPAAVTCRLYENLP